MCLAPILPPGIPRATDVDRGVRVASSERMHQIYPLRYVPCQWSMPPLPPSASFREMDGNGASVDLDLDLSIFWVSWL
jgi:hypothetical protein